MKKQGVEIERYNLSQQPQMFVKNPLVKAALDEDQSCLPLIIVDGKVVSKGVYVSLNVLASYVGIELPKSVYSEAVQELVAIGAAIASNCESCFKYHFVEAQKLGVSKEDIARAVDTAAGVKSVPARSIIKYAQKFLSGVVDDVKSSSCCSPGNVDDGSKKPCC